MKASTIVKAVLFGLLFAIFAIGLLPFLVANSLAEISGSSEFFDLGGIAPLFKVPPSKKQDTENEDQSNEDI
ncbi:hypothetical protein [Paenibacillus glycanilyticus]|uniref:Uncharacterized protein n=1 Tax=Paenibacillus glycanilyticus TaxID=126569 RepID=A0ABQ6G8A7_9BACL|nr:hypothetical protein [Paenibacillus glycanilyticus]GLX66515.1 hypothetical protein MU1_08590 [Paenibacillus glycanilyticus]